MSETTIQASIQSKLRALPEFNDDDVVIADWSMLDGPIASAPYARIMPADDFTWRQDTREVIVSWTIPVVLYVEFFQWAGSYAEMVTLRQAVLNAFDGDDSSLDASGYAMLTQMSAGTPIGYYYPPYISDQNDPEALPMALFQVIAFAVQERICS